MLNIEQTVTGSRQCSPEGCREAEAPTFAPIPALVMASYYLIMSSI